MPGEPDKPTVAGGAGIVGAAVPALCLATGLHSAVCLEGITTFIPAFIFLTYGYILI